MTVAERHRTRLAVTGVFCRGDSDIVIYVYYGNRWMVRFVGDDSPSGNIPVSRVGNGPVECLIAAPPRQTIYEFSQAPFLYEKDE